MSVRSVGTRDTTSLFAALEVATGQVIGKCQRRHRAQDFLNFLHEVDRQLPAEPEVHLVMDNYGTHKTSKVKLWFARRPRYHLHFTPISASWLNQEERFFAEITQRRSRRGTFTHVRELELAIHDRILLVWCISWHPTPLVISPAPRSWWTVECSPSSPYLTSKLFKLTDCREARQTHSEGERLVRRFSCSCSGHRL